MTQRTGADDGWRQLFYDCRNTLASIGLVVLIYPVMPSLVDIFKNEKFRQPARRSEAILYL